MAGRPRLFISHSSRNQALTEQIRDALQAPAGGHPGFEVLVDVDRLRAGEEWPIQLHAMMAHADAGLILSFAKTPSANEVVDLSAGSGHHLSSMITLLLP